MKKLPTDHPMNLTKEEEAKLPTTNKGGNTSLVSLHGVKMKEDGTLVKSKYFNILNNTMDEYPDVVMTIEEGRKLKAFMGGLAHGSTAAMPIICMGNLCPFRTRCVYYQMGKAPVGLPCLVELNLMKQWQMSFYEEYELDIDNKTEMFILNELVEIELMLYRCNTHMALNVDEAVGVVDQPVAVDNQGNALYAKQISQFVELREKLLNRKHKLIKLMVGDRQEKYKREAALKVREDKDPSSQMSAIREKLNKLEREMTVIHGKTTTVSESNSPISPDDIMTDNDD